MLSEPGDRYDPENRFGDGGGGGNMTGVLGWVLVLVTGVIKSEGLDWGKHRVCKELTVVAVQLSGDQHPAGD